MRGLIEKLKKNLVDFGQDESGMGVIEVILIILVLVRLILQIVEVHFNFIIYQIYGIIYV